MSAAARVGWGKRTERRYSVEKRLGWWVVRYYHDIPFEDVPFDRLVFAPVWLHPTHEEAERAAQWVIDVITAGGITSLYYDWSHFHKREHGCFPKTFHIMLMVQQGHCGYCDQIKGRLDVDHNHLTGEIRSLLCRKCNLGFSVGSDYERCDGMKARMAKWKAHTAQIRSQNKSTEECSAV